MEIAEKIKVLRNKNRLTQAQLADLIGVSRQAEAKWESGASAPDILKIWDLAKVLGTTSDVLLSPDPLKADEGRTPTGFLSERLTLKVSEKEIPAVNALLSSLGYVSTSPEGKGSLLLLDPISFFAAKQRNFFHLGFGLEPAELVNVEHEKRRSSLIYGAKVEAAFREAIDAEKSINSSRHLARGIVYLCFAPFSLAVLGCSIVLAENVSPFFLILTFAMLLFTILFIVQGIMQSVLDRLIDQPHRLSLLFTPPFDKTLNDPGYIKGYMPGIRENGGQYTHAAIWTAWAFTCQGDGKQAGVLFDLLNSIIRSDTKEKAFDYRVEPYVSCADIYSKSPLLGRGGWTWYTGSAAWMYRLGMFTP